MSLFISKCELFPATLSESCVPFLFGVSPPPKSVGHCPLEFTLLFCFVVFLILADGVHVFSRSRDKINTFRLSLVSFDFFRFYH